MRTMASAGVAAAVMIGLGAAVALGQTPIDVGRKSQPPGLLSGLFESKSERTNKSANKGNAAPLLATPSPVAAAASLRAGYERVFLRRIDVCNQLRNIANQTGNPELWWQADALDARAWEIYRQQTAALSGVAMPAVSVLANDGQPSGRLQPFLGANAIANAPSQQAVLNDSSRGGQ